MFCKNGLWWVELVYRRHLEERVGYLSEMEVELADIMRKQGGYEDSGCRAAPEGSYIVEVNLIFGAKQMFGVGNPTADGQHRIMISGFWNRRSIL